MSRKKVIVVGDGGHAKVIIDILQSTDNVDVLGFTALSDSVLNLCGVPYLGDDSVLPDLLSKDIHSFVVALGDNMVRRMLFNKLVNAGFAPANAISPSAYVSPHAHIGNGVVIMPGAVINACASIGDNTIINTLAGVDHDCKVSSHVHIGPGVSLAGCVQVGEGSFIGIGSGVIPNVRIGEWATIGAGSAVISDIPSNVKVVGVPAKKII